jgi:hypothetical protein
MGEGEYFRTKFTLSSSHPKEGKTMAAKSDTGPRYLEMTYERGPMCWVIRPRLDTTVTSIEYPPDEEILWLAAESGMSAEFRECPKRPKTLLFRLVVVSRSTATQRQAFLESLEKRAMFHCRKFTDTELMDVTKMLSQGPLYEVAVEEKRLFLPLQRAAAAQNSWFTRVEVGDLVLEVIGAELTLRAITREEINRINDLSDEIDAEK